MPVVVDHQPLSVDALGLRTFGQVLSHLQKENRLVVRVLVDGQEPDAEGLAALRAAPMQGQTIFVETTAPREIAEDVLTEVEAQLDEADRLLESAGTAISTGGNARAFEHLWGCFSRWQHVQESFSKIAQLLRIDLGRVSAGPTPMPEFIASFGEKLRAVKTALEDRDFVALGDVLRYELPESTAGWRSAVQSMRSAVRGEG